jgi:hypothetical protein
MERIILEMFYTLLTVLVDGAIFMWPLAHFATRSPNANDPNPSHIVTPLLGEKRGKLLLVDDLK